MFPDATSATRATELLTGKLMLPNSNKLTLQASVWLGELEGSFDEKTIGKELSQLYHEVSKVLRKYPPDMGAGLYIAGAAKPTEIAVALCILYAQSHDCFNLSAFYEDDKTQLRGGKVVKSWRGRKLAG
jgi:hypothetical protein